MNKSTPLSQLPSTLQGTNPNQNTFVTDQQKQIITQQQQAINSISMPQNTQLPQDIINDDDATIQEVLNHISSQSQGQSQSQMQGQSQPLQGQFQGNIQQSQANIGLPHQGSGMLSSNDIGFGTAGYDNMLLQNMLNQMPSQQLPHVNTNAVHSSTIDMFMNVFADDIKLALLVLVMVIVVNFVPITTLLGRYIAIEKIPYHDILLKAILVAVLVVMLKRFIV